MNFKDFFKQNKKAIRFLLVFVGLYVLLNTAYGFFIQSYNPTCDPITYFVAKEVVWFLSLFDSSVNGFPSAFNVYVAIANSKESVIDVFEGCNGINVMIVYISFLVAFNGSLRLLTKYVAIGFVAIHLLNLLRVALLYGVAIHFPNQLYFFHKYLFTGIIYVIVFILWFYWVRDVKNEQG